MASRFWVGGAGTWDASDTTHWAATSNGAGGQSVPGSGDTVTIDGSSGAGTITVNTSFTVTSISCGAMGMTLDFATNNNSPTMNTFTSTGTGTRTINMGNGTWTLAGNAGTIFDMGTTTNLTLNPNSSTINCTYSGSTGTRTLSFPSTSFPLNHLKISAGSDAVTTSAHSVSVNDLDFNGFTGTWNLGVTTVNGNFRLGANMTVTSSSNTITLAATSSKTVTSNSVQCNVPITLNGVNGQWTLQDNLDMSGASLRALGLTNGTFNANGFTVTCGSFSSNNSNTRAISMGSGTWTLGGTSTIWNTGTTTGLTITPSNSTIKITDTSNTAITFAGGGMTFANIYWNRGASTATNTITGTNIFADFKDDGTGTHTITFPNVTTTVSSFTVSGISGHLITLARTGGSGTFTLSKPNSSVSCDYLSISNSVATGGAVWYAGANSTDGGGNTGWIFTAPPTPVITKGGGGVQSIGNIASLRLG